MMDIPLKMPDLATTGATVKVLRWLVAAGTVIRRGDPILEVETDKAVMQVEAAAAGVLKAIVADEGAEVDAGETIAVLEGDDSAASQPSKDSPQVAEAAPPRPTRPAIPEAGGRRSFFARNREARSSGGLAAIALSVPQKVAARRLAESQATVPHFYLQTSADAGPMVARRKAAVGGLAWDAFFVRAAARAIRTFDRMRCRFEDDRLIPAPALAVGVAVDVDGDLFTLSIDEPGRRPLESISREIVDRVERIRAGDAEARIARPASLTISNLGGSGVESFAAIVNPPESAVLAVGKVMPAVTAIDGRVVVQERVNLTLSVDHRVASGKYAAGFLSAIVRELESIGGGD
ncbi:2-oxo acid dehydrogenase subunit E2 [Paludisphaera mucosa]|uniref:Dihydrolipoamide acetyltransferase component of pyruvate dehydrogenase complex n=1 Tax=Paludisphaera mucosa TaxID=3030827 RepID=A0ABT6FJG4_9BACT|nr:2-oxo acid dehydrogenase subunit E2 [Paludisphaera mucosa]MDG3007722.1 2-oxo acid dehydrogenase subunit E2 [Paludisphaera mucosa]